MAQAGSRYHINEKGEAGPCRATLACPFGDDKHHFGSVADARKAYELVMSSSTWPVPASNQVRAAEALEALVTARSRVIFDKVKEQMGYLRNEAFTTEGQRKEIDNELARFRQFDDPQADGATRIEVLEGFLNGRASRGGREKGQAKQVTEALIDIYSVALEEISEGI